MPNSYENKKSYHIPWYAASANRHLQTLGRLSGEVNCDICVIGAGFTGLSTALELSKQGFEVVLLESGTVASGASGRNGGQLQRGYPKSPDTLVAKYGKEDARTMCDITLEGINLITGRIREYDIDCNLAFGQLSAGLDKRQLDELKGEQDAWAAIGHDDMKMLDEAQVQSLVKTPLYKGGLIDEKGAHFHPLNYALGIAAAAQSLGCRIYENTRALELVQSSSPRVVTEKGAVTAKFVVLAGAIALKGSAFMIRHSITATAHIIATEPLGQERIDKIITRNLAVCDARFIMDYYRLSADGRLLFGGNCNYSAMEYPGEAQRLYDRMTALFPALDGVKIDHCWHGPLEFTINRLPHLGRLSPAVYYAHGFGGQGVVATNITGKVLAEAISGTMNRFDVFAKIRHAPFAGGNLLKRPLFVLGMTWYRLRDALGA
jgi:gamma-glutamylputrescine oxidase